MSEENKIHEIEYGCGCKHEIQPGLTSDGSPSGMWESTGKQEQCKIHGVKE